LDDNNPQLKQAIIEKQLSGYVLQTPHPEYFWTEAQAIGIPFVFLGSRIDKSGVANLVTFDWEYTGYCGTKHLLKSGYERIGFLHSVEMPPEFLQGCRKAYLEIKGKGDPFLISSHVADIIGKVDAAIILDDVFAHKAIKEIIAKRIDVPRELALAVVMNKGMFFDFPLKLTALELAPVDVIQAAFNILLSQIRGEKKYHEQILIKPSLIIGETT
jgi:DNA-binding LacI/PurR family transcriptional regulator